MEPVRPRVERKGRFTITDITPVSPVASPHSSVTTVHSLDPIVDSDDVLDSDGFGATTTAAAVATSTPEEPTAPSYPSLPPLDASQADKAAPLVLPDTCVELEPEPSPVLAAHVDAATHLQQASAPAAVETQQAAAVSTVVMAPVVFSQSPQSSPRELEEKAHQGVRTREGSYPMYADDLTYCVYELCIRRRLL